MDLQALGSPQAQRQNLSMWGKFRSQTQPEI